MNYCNLLWIGNLSSNKGSGSTAAIGGAVGGAILLISIGIFIVVIFHIKRSHKYKQKTRTPLTVPSHQELQAMESYNKSSADNNMYTRNPDTINTSSFVISNPLLDLIDRKLTESSEG